MTSILSVWFVKESETVDMDLIESDIETPEVVSDNEREDLKQFTIPTLIAHGDADRIVSFDISSKLAHEQIKGSRLEMIKGAPHGLAATHSEQLSELLLDFLGG